MGLEARGVGKTAPRLRVADGAVPIQKSGVFVCGIGACSWPK